MTLTCTYVANIIKRVSQFEPTVESDKYYYKYSEAMDIEGMCYIIVMPCICALMVCLICQPSTLGLQMCYH